MHSSFTTNIQFQNRARQIGCCVERGKHKAAGDITAHIFCALAIFIVCAVCAYRALRRRVGGCAHPRRPPFHLSRHSLPVAHAPAALLYLRLRRPSLIVRVALQRRHRLE
jgi:hypothetical protein